MRLCIHQKLKIKLFKDVINLRYGNWRMPSKNYYAGLHDGAIVERGF
jgi:hypothetical protein